MNSPSPFLPSDASLSLFDNIEQWEVMCNELAMDVSEKIYKAYQQLEHGFYYKGSVNANWCHEPDTKPHLTTVFQTSKPQFFNDIYGCVIGHIAPFLLAPGNFTLKLRSLEKSLEHNALSVVPQLAHQSSGVCQNTGVLCTPEKMQEDVQHVIDYFDRLKSKSSGYSNVGYMEMKKTLWEKRLQHNLDTHSFTTLLGQALTHSLDQVALVVETIAQAQSPDTKPQQGVHQVIQWKELRQKIKDTRYERNDVVTSPSLGTPTP